MIDIYKANSIPLILYFVCITSTKFELIDWLPTSTTRAAAKATAIRTNITNMMATNAALFSSKYTEYVTPKKLYEELDNEFGFALDAATTEDNPLKIPIYFTKEDNALSKDWHYTVVDSQWVRRNAVYVNLPYILAGTLQSG
jgi:hypothetical protein